MTSTEKMKVALESIKEIYPKKMILNGSQTATIIGISYRTFARLIENQNYDRLPKYRSEEVIRANGLKNTKYYFNIFDITEFLIKN